MIKGTKEKNQEQLYCNSGTCSSTSLFNDLFFIETTPWHGIVISLHTLTILGLSHFCVYDFVYHITFCTLYYLIIRAQNEKQEKGDKKKTFFPRKAFSLVFGFFSGKVCFVEKSLLRNFFVLRESDFLLFFGSEDFFVSW